MNNQQGKGEAYKFEASGYQRCSKKVIGYSGMTPDFVIFTALFDIYIQIEIGVRDVGVCQGRPPEISPKIKGLSFSQCQFVLITIILMEITTQEMFYAPLYDL